MKSVSELLTIEGAFSAKYLFTKLKTDYYLPTQIHNYRVEQQTLLVEFLLNCYRMLQDINLKIGTDNPLVLSYDMFKA